MSIYSGPEFLELEKLLTNRMSQVPAWHDLAMSVTKVLEKEIETPRRKLARMRDGLAYRKLETLKHIDYSGVGSLYDQNNNLTTLPIGQHISKAKILKLTLNGESNKIEQDYALIEFELENGLLYRWNMPISAPQEKSLVVQNAVMLGFDFFNTELNTEDYHRIQEFIAQYWPQGGTENFIRFISFIKNIKLEMQSLYTYDEDDDNDDYRYLETRETIRNPDYQGFSKDWYLTSHVSLSYDPFKDIDETTINSLTVQSDFYRTIERIFYYFAPIHLVLERIIAAINLHSDFFTAQAGSSTQYELAKFDWLANNQNYTNFMQAVSALNVTYYTAKYKFVGV